MSAKLGLPHSQATKNEPLGEIPRLRPPRVLHHELVHDVILVDALDEALGYSQDVNIVSLLAESSFLPTNVRFILTTRPDERVENQFRDTDGLILSSTEFDERNQQDLTQYINYRMFHDEVLVAELNSEQVSNYSDRSTFFSANVASSTSMIER